MYVSSELTGDFSQLTVAGGVSPSEIMPSITTVNHGGSSGAFTYAPEQREALLYSVAGDVMVNAAIVTPDGRVAEDVVQERGVQDFGVHERIWDKLEYRCLAGRRDQRRHANGRTGIRDRSRQWRTVSRCICEIGDYTTARHHDQDARYHAGETGRAVAFVADIASSQQQGTFGLLASNDQFLWTTRFAATSPVLLAVDDTAGSRSTFTIVSLGENEVAIRDDSGYYVSPQGDSVGSVYVKATTISSRERLEVISFGHSQVAFRTYNGRYLTKSSDDTITAIATKVGKDEIFRLVDLGGPTAATNVALGKPCHPVDDRAVPIDGSLAVNGVLTDFSHTNAEDYTPHLEVDLGKEFAIERIQDFTRADCCTPNGPERDYNITFEILDANRNSVYRSPVFNPWNGIGSPANLGNGAVLELDLLASLGHKVTGRYVRVNKQSVAGSAPDSEFLSIGELRVFGEEPRLSSLVDVVGEYGTIQR